MSSMFGSFAGKTLFAGQATGPAFFMTTWSQHGSATKLPAMSAVKATAAERAITYIQPDGTVRVQLASLLWIALDPGLGWLTLTPSFADAVAVKLTGSPAGQQWQVRTASGWAQVSYSVDVPSPLLTINGGGVTDFSASVVTPGLEALRRDGGCTGGDFSSVSLAGADLSGLTLPGADFTGADLTGGILKAATLTKAVFAGATLAGTTWDRAVLDQADFTGTTLDGLAWTDVQHAHGVILTGCSARGATLGGQPSPLDCTGAQLGSGDFTGCNLDGMILNGAHAAGVILAHCQMRKVVLDDANIENAVAVGANLQGASMVGVNAGGATFAGADLSGATLTRARMGAKAYLFSLPGSFVGELDTDAYVQPDLVAAFATNGVTLSKQDRVTVLTPGQRWRVQDPANAYVLRLNGGGGVDVCLDAGSVRPAVLCGAIAPGVRASGINLAGADLRGIQWHGAATLDHADLEDACLAGSLLAGTNFTQAYLSGADLSRCVLVQSAFKGCVIGPGAGQQPFSLEASQIQGADFTGSTLLGVTLVDAALALAPGVPLLTLPLADQQYLTPQGIGSLAAPFQQAGYPLGANPTVKSFSSWTLDNKGCANPAMPAAYSVRLQAGQLSVFDGVSNTFLFDLPLGDQALLAGTTAPPPLITAFGQQSYTLVAGAPISASASWAIEVDAATAPQPPAYYPTLMVHATDAHLVVYGSTVVKVQGWPQYPEGLGFAATTLTQAALDAASLGPCGYPNSVTQQRRLDWTAFCTSNAVLPR